MIGVFSYLIATNSCATTPNDTSLGISQLEAQPSSWQRDTMLIKKYHALAYGYLYKNAILSTQYGQKALELALDRQWEKGKLLAYSALSYYYYLNGDMDLLMELANESIEIAHKNHMPVFEAEAYRFVAHGFTEHLKFDSAYNNYQKVLRIIGQEKNDSLQASYHESLGSYYRNQEKIPQALAEYAKARSILKSMNSTAGLAHLTLSHGYLYIYTHEYSKANDYFKHALTLFDQLDSDYGRMSAYNDLANGYYLQKEYDLAISNALKAREIADRYYSPRQTNWALTTLYRSYRDMGNLREALRYMEDLNYNNRNNFDDSMERRFNLFQLLHDNERKDVAIRNSELAQQRSLQQFLVVVLILVLVAAGLLWRKNQELRKKNKEIKEALVRGQTLERKRVAAELHDTLGGTISAINWYMSGINKASLPKAEQQIYDRLQDMITGAYMEIRSISHNYLPRVLEKDGLVQALQQLVDKLNQNNQVRFELDIKGIGSRPDRQVEFELYSTVLELANNILKHAEAKHAFISLTGSKKQFVLIIADDGKGFDETHNEGMGLRNVRNRVQSLGGNLVKTNEKDRGAFIQITIPRNQETFA